MNNCTNCQDSNLNKNYSLDTVTPFCQNCSNENSACIVKMDADCVIYHLDNTSVSKLVNLNLPNNTSLSIILEAIDTAISSINNSSIISSTYKVKISATDFPDYLLNKIEGGTDGVVSTTILGDSGRVQILPSLNITALLEAIRNDATLRATIKQIVNLP